MTREEQIGGDQYKEPAAMCFLLLWFTRRHLVSHYLYLISLLLLKVPRDKETESEGPMVKER